MSHIRSRFSRPVDDLVVNYTTSLPFDWRLYPYDIRGSIAHAQMLGKQGIIGKDEAEKISAGLNSILKEIEAGDFVFKTEVEDIHMAVEDRLFEICGGVAGKLHTARSRNDQVATDMRLFVKDVIREVQAAIAGLQNSLLTLAEANARAVMPGYTHLQPGQPVLFAHHLLAYFEMLKRDTARFSDCLMRVDELPLGSGSLAGAAYDIDRNFVAKELGFVRISNNSMDAVCDRDFVIEFAADASICMMHLSRLAEELILWSSAEFGFIEMDDAYATGSSLMPQKKNPDVAELGRGKTGRVYGHLVSLLTMMKGLPLTYNRDLQEDKEPLFDTLDTLQDSLRVFSGMVASLKVNTGKMEKAVERGYLLATDIADYLVRKGEAFRSAHGIVARLVSYAQIEGKVFSGLSLEEYKSFSPLFEKDVFDVSAASSMASRNAPGGTAPAQVAAALATARKRLDNSL